MDSMFAYSLSQAEKGWRWCIYDQAGEIVAFGVGECQSEAKAAVERGLNRAAVGALKPVAAAGARPA